MPDDSSPAPRPALPGFNRLGLCLFLVYLVVYATFVGIAAFSGSTLSQRPFGGVNLAIIAGFVLIVSPLILAIVYLWGVRGTGKRDESGKES